jgi:hypothetical protein
MESIELERERDFMMGREARDRIYDAILKEAEGRLLAAKCALLACEIEAMLQSDNPGVVSLGEVGQATEAAKRALFAAESRARVVRYSRGWRPQLNE